MKIQESVSSEALYLQDSTKKRDRPCIHTIEEVGSSARDLLIECIWLSALRVGTKGYKYSLASRQNPVGYKQFYTRV